MNVKKFQRATFEEARDFIVSKGLNSLKEDDDGFFCEILMSGCRDLEKNIALLISAGVDVNAPMPWWIVQDKLTPLINVVITKKKSHHLIDLLLANGADIEAPSDRGFTPLHCAVISQNLDLVKYLIAKGANPNTVSAEGDSCLILALSTNDEHKNRDHYWLGYNDHGLDNKKVSFEILDELVQSGVGLDHKGKFHCSVAESAIKNGKVEVIDWLFKHGITPTDTISPNSSETLLMAACNFCDSSIAVINHLLSSGANVDAVDQFGRTALFYVGNNKAAIALVNAGAKLTHLDNEGRSIFHAYPDKNFFLRFAKKYPFIPLTHVEHNAI